MLRSLWIGGRGEVAGRTGAICWSGQLFFRPAVAASRCSAHASFAALRACVTRVDPARCRRVAKCGPQALANCGPARRNQQ